MYFKTVLFIMTFEYALSLLENGENVLTVTTYTKEKYTVSCDFWKWGRCTKYRKKTNKSYECKAGWKSTDGDTCPNAICDKKINPEACNKVYSTSHIVYGDGSTKYSSGGKCVSPDTCADCNKGFFPKDKYCRMCTAISSCDLEECTTDKDQKCTRCEGVSMEIPGHRAYVASADRTTCIKACSWRGDSTWCYPGTCQDEYASNCKCSSTFGGKHCQTMSAKPNIRYNILRLTADNGDTSEAPPDVNSGPSQDTIWTKISSPTTVYYKFTTDYRAEQAARHAFIEGFSVGIASASAHFSIKRGGRQVWSKTVACSGAHRDTPVTDLFTCEDSPIASSLLALPLQHGDIIDFTYEAKNGGFVKVRNKESNVLTTHYYNGATEAHQFSMNIDLENPYHCTGTTTCVNTMLTAPNLIKTSTINLRWSDWKDNDAGIDHFLIEVYELHVVGNKLRDKRQVLTKTVPSSTTTDSVALTEVGIYSVLLSAYDKADNHKSTRRVFIYDGTSSVSTRSNTKLQVTTASTAAAGQWQTASSSAVSVDWADRYTNTLHHNNKWLLGIAAVSGLDSLYDDKEGDRTLDPINNVNGITRITTSYKTDHKGGTTIESTPNDSDFTNQGLSQSQTISPSLVDGDTLRFWVRAYDVMSSYKEESVSVHIDTTQPIIDNLWLTRGDRLDISVHRIEDLNEMTMEWIAYDVHSGLETVSWRVVDKYERKNIAHGIENMRAQGETDNLEDCKSRYASAARGANCYCTPGVGCYHRHFQVKPLIVDSSVSHGGIFRDKAKGVHDSDYHIEVTVTNHARLTKTLQFKITIDTSPPTAGHVHDGLVEQSEIDYQDSLQLHAYWDGFFDRESGVKFYQYKFGPQCLKFSDFGLDDPSLKVTETYLTSTSWTAPSVGKYHVTVVAYNRALEPSDPVCSDGVTIDTTPPSLSEVAVAATRVVEGLVKTSDGSVWIIDAERRRSQISEPDAECRLKSTDIDDTKLSLFPTHRFLNEAGMKNTKDNCSLYTSYPSAFINKLYLYEKHMLMVNWTGSDSESGIYDYELGLMSDPSGEAAPDILPYTSTHHHPQYQGYNPGLSEGQQFYIGVKATNKARLSVTKVLGPVIVHITPPVFTGAVTVSLNRDQLVVQWTRAFTDPESQYLKYMVAIGTTPYGPEILLYQPIQAGDTCTVTSPPTCTAIAIRYLQWDLHHSHTYFVSIRVTNIVGLSTVGVSKPYVHDVRLPSRGVVLDVCPIGEESLFAISKFEDADHQLSTTNLTARWYGFENGLEKTIYEVGLGSEPSLTDVKDFVPVGGDLEYVFSDLSLQLYKKYFVTVEAIRGADTTRASSNGVMVIQHSDDLSDVIVRDGPGCSRFSAEFLKSGENRPECINDVEYQVSTSVIAAHWDRSDVSQAQYPDGYWSLEKLLPRTATWQTVRDYEHLGTSERIVTGGVFLEPGYTYRASVKFCAVSVCSLPNHSDGITVIPHPPKPGSISLKYEKTVDKSYIHVTMDKFRDPDILLTSESYDVMDRYEWSLPDNSDSSRLLEAWQGVDVSSISSGEEKMNFTITLPGQLEFTKCRRLAVRGYNKAGMCTVISEDVTNCRQSDPSLILPSIVIDAVGDGVTVGGDVGQAISLELNSIWRLPDADYTPYKNILSAVWPTLRHRNYTWAVVSDDNIGPTFHYKRDNIMTVSDPCDMPGVIKCGTTDNEYINVNFPPDSYLQHGKRFYICIHADEMNTAFEKWTAQLSEVNVCSDGITVDLTAPEAGMVTVEGLTEDNVQVSSTEVDIKWTGFTDVEEENAISHSSGIAHYEVAIGGVPGGADVSRFINVGQVNRLTLHSLNLLSGSVLYATVRATDFVNKTKEVVSGGVTVDATPPVLTGRQLQMEDRYITSRLVHVCWTDVFSDKESGLKAFMVAIGTKPGYDDTSTYTYTDQTCTDVDTLDSVKEGYSYYISIKGYNKAGLYTLVSSRPLVVSSTPPPSGHVYDARKETSAADNIDKDFVTSSSEMGAHWEGFQDPNSLITIFKVKVGTCPGCDDKLEEFEYGTRKDITFHHTSFPPGVKYYTTVTACSVAGLCSSSTSDGIIIDSTAPVTGTVDDGTGDRDIQFQASRTYLGSKWRGFYDPDVGLDHYEWRIGTTPGGDEILTARSVALEELAFHTLPRDEQLPVGQRLYITVRAYNRAGSHSETTSNGFTVDNSPPSVISQPALTPGFASFVSMTTVSRTTLSVQWEFRDQESFIDRQYLSLSSHQLGEFPRSILMVPGFLKEYIYTNLDLHDGSRYRIKVTACNMAGLCTSKSTDEFLVDSTKPKTGTFAVETAHAARLSRHQSGGMTWTSNTLTLSWLGFSDLHSGVHHYIVTLGSQPFGTDLNKDETQAQVPHDSGGVDKGDEGIIQTVTVPTEYLNEQDTVFVAIWAVNVVGLASDPYHGEVVLDGDRVLWLVRRCQRYNCEGQCVCGVQDKTCSASSGCSSLTNGGPNDVVSVNDVINLTFPPEVTDVDFSPTDTVMAATWFVTTSKGLPVQRYEYSIGECGFLTPTGIFTVATDRVWFDAGHSKSAVISLPRGKSLSPGLKYCFFVRAWYDSNTFSVFKSDGITIDLTVPSFTQKLGISVKELKGAGGSKDVDFQKSTDRTILNWTNKFLQGHSDLLKYRVYISSSPGGHSIHESKDLITTSYTATGLSLEPDTVYYSSVLVYNKAGLVSWTYSDGVQVDVVPPVAGMVHDGQDIHDIDYQSSASEVSASWYGFSDTDSTIVKYYWCVGLINDVATCDVVGWEDIGLHTSSTIKLNSPLPSGTVVWNKIYAIDAVGHTSATVLSNGVTIDTSPPEPQKIAYLGDNIIANPSFELNAIVGTSTECNSILPTSWGTDTESCIKIVSPESPVAKHGNMFVSVSGTIQQTVTNMDIGIQYKLSIHTGYPQTVSTNHKPVEATVTIAGDSFTFSLDPNLCKGTCQAGDDSVILWNTHTYRFTARDTTSVLKISSSSRAMEFVLDHVRLQTVDYGSSSSSGDTENHLLVHSVFLSHWSSLHASWYFQDTESPIIQYKWAVGAVKGGTQHQSFRNVGRHTQSTAADLQLSHGSKLYITVMATNAAGLTTVSFSDPLTVDMTAPELKHVWDGTGADADYQSSNVVSVNWLVHDEQSGVSYCDWAVGRTKGRSDVKKFERVPPEESKAQHDVSDILTNNTITVYSTVRCFNKAGLVAAATSDGVTVLPVSTETSIPGFAVLRERQSVHTQRGVCHRSQEYVRLHWDQPVQQLSSVVVGITGANINRQKSVLNYLDYTYAKLCGLKLTNESSYEAFMYPVDVLDVAGERTATLFTVHGKSPKLSESKRISVTRDGVKLAISWTSLFVSQWSELYYEIHIGTVAGGADVFGKTITEKNDLRITLKEVHSKNIAVYLSITAIDPCGYTAFYSNKIKV